MRAVHSASLHDSSEVVPTRVMTEVTELASTSATPYKTPSRRRRLLLPGVALAAAALCVLVLGVRLAHKSDSAGKDGAGGAAAAVAAPPAAPVALPASASEAVPVAPPKQPDVPPAAPSARSSPAPNQARAAASSTTRPQARPGATPRGATPNVNDPRLFAR
jgi:hypothetical protein